MTYLSVNSLLLASKSNKMRLLCEMCLDLFIETMLKNNPIEPCFRTCVQKGQ